MKKVILSAIIASIGLTMFFSCKQQEPQQEKEATKVDTLETVKPSKAVTISPIDISAYGNLYTINSYEIDKDTLGQTIITATGNGFGTLKFVDGQMIIPVWGAFVSNGKKYTANSASASQTSVVYYFKTSKIPDSLVFYPADDESKKIEINCK